MFNLFKKQKSFDYPLINPPFAFKPLKQMNEEEAQHHLEWFVSQSEVRRRILFDVVGRLGGNKNALDYTPESLIPLWKTMSSLFEKRPLTAEEKTKFYKSIPAAANKLKFSLQTQTTQTLCIAIDIGYYVAEIYMRRYSQVHWIVFKHKSMSFNKPALSGFYLPLVPADMVKGSIGKQLKTPKDTHLFDIYQKWVTNLS